MANKRELYFELSAQAFKSELPSLGGGIYNALPNHFGKALDQLTTLCNENGICPMCAFTVDDCHCEEYELDQ